jgi:hypothetical protein
MESGGSLQEWIFVIGYVSFIIFIAWRVVVSSSSND